MEPIDRLLKTRARGVSHLNEMDGEGVPFAHVQRLRLDLDAPLGGHLDLQRHAPPGGFVVKRVDQASADAQVVNRHGYGEEAEAPVIKRTADTYKPPPRGRRNGVSGCVWHRSAAKCGRNAVYRRGASSTFRTARHCLADACRGSSMARSLGRFAPVSLGSRDEDGNGLRGAYRSTPRCGSDRSGGSRDPLFTRYSLSRSSCTPGTASPPNAYFGFFPCVRNPTTRARSCSISRRIFSAVARRFRDVSPYVVQF